jgi:large subunit ribosomal protein L10
VRRTKPHPKKEQTLKELKERLSRTNVAIFTDYRGLTVTQITQLRRQLEGANVEYHVAKNTLLRLAADQTGFPNMGGMLEGPTAVAFGFGEETAVAKALTAFATTSKILTIKGGVVGRRLLGADEVSSLATSPSKEQLFAQVLGTLQSPAAGIMGVLNGPTRSLLYLLQQRAEQLEAQAGA